MRRWLLALLLTIPLAAEAGPPKKDELPAALRDWTDWVLHGESQAGCPFLQSQSTRVCAWPGRLQLSLDSKGGRFTQSFRVYRESWLPLPGDTKHWPQNVQADGRPAVVVPGQTGDGGKPLVKLSPGEHTVSGEYAWDALPEALVIPEGTGLLSLTVKGAAIALPNRDAEGRVYLQKESAEKEAERVEIIAHRLVTDGIPLTLSTRLTLNVSGTSRELLLGRALPDGFVPMSLESRLPVRIEPDGRLRLQVRPGNWSLELVARSEGPVQKLARPKADGPWAEQEEIWVFDARPSLRQVLVEGVPAVDPQVTTLPARWKRFPAYAMGPSDTMVLSERRRGDSDPAPDVLNLTRTLWLDFDGKGYTVSDRIGGQLHRSWRLDMQPGTELGRVVAAGADQSITRLGNDGPAGVELRQGGLALEADSRIRGDVGTVSAVSWNADFSSVRTTLQVPPGWTLLHASGADSVPGTWVQRWSLLDLFLVLIIGLAFGRLFGPVWGGLALVSLALTWQEGELVPQYSWLAVLAGEALLRVLPEGRFRTLVKVYRLGAWVALVSFSLVFMVQHVREAMYPALAQQRQLGGVESWSEYSNENAVQYQRSNSITDALSSNDVGGFVANGPAKPPPAQGLAQTQEEVDGKESEEQAETTAEAPPPPPPPEAINADRAKYKGDVSQLAGSGLRKQRSFNVRDYDKNATVQTGPGLPRWQWKSLAVNYSGPVDKGQQLHLWLMGPAANLVLSIIRVLLLALLVLATLGLPGGFWPAPLRRWLRAPVSWRPWPQRDRTKTAAAAAVLLALALPGASARAQPAPSPETLQELKRRLLEAPDCAPACASSPRMLVEATPSVLRLRMEVLAGAETAVPLPGNAQHWVPETVLVDGKPSASLWRAGNGTLWLALAEGAHQVQLEGALPPRATVQIELPLRPHRVEAKVDGWTLDGLHEDGLSDENLQLSRKGAGEKGAGAALQLGTLPPFVRVERELVLGLQWTVETRVQRMTPTGAAVVLEVPLLPGESVTSSEARVQGGKALVNMPASSTEASWSSVLDSRSPIELTAPKGIPWVEVWRLDVSPVWHVQLSGIPVVAQQDAFGAKLPEWRPWPGESVKVEVVRPASVQGQTLTIDQSSLDVTPGARATDVTFTANLRSSRGGLHALKLPEGAELQSVTINGAQQPIRQEGRTVALPLVPGSMSIALSWRQSGGMSGVWHTPELEAGTPTVNADLNVRVPEDRWVLFLWGPRMGPAVLFWSFLLVLLLVSVGLGRNHWTPLRTRHWVLLALGLSQVPIPAILVVFGWLLLLGWRKKQDLPGGWFNLRQLLVVGATAVAIAILAASVHAGLLGQPEMQVSGNGSGPWALRWFQDRTELALPTATIVSAPMLVYRAAMLAWSMWMALAMLGWLRWGWQSFAEGGLWRRKPAPVVAAIPVPPAPPPPAT